MDTSTITPSHHLRTTVLAVVALVAGVLLARPASFTAVPSLPDHQPSARAEIESKPVPGTVQNENPADTSSGICAEDRVFLERAIQSGIKQERVSRGVLPELVYPESREYAYLLLTDEAATQPELQNLAAHKGVNAPEPEKIPFRKWARADGVIDTYYIDLVVTDNRDVAALFEKAAKSKDAEISSFAQKTLPLIQHHLTASLDLEKVKE